MVSPSRSDEPVPVAEVEGVLRVRPVEMDDEGQSCRARAHSRTRLITPSPASATRMATSAGRRKARLAVSPSLAERRRHPACPFDQSHVGAPTGQLRLISSISSSMVAGGFPVLRPPSAEPWARIGTVGGAYHFSGFAGGSSQDLAVGPIAGRIRLGWFAGRHRYAAWSGRGPAGRPYTSCPPLCPYR